MANIAPIPEVPVPPSSGRPGGLGALLERTLLRWVVQAFNAIRERFSEMVRQAVDRTLENLEVPLIQMLGPALDRALAEPNVPDEIKQIVRSVRSGEHQVGAFVLTVAAAILVGPTLSALFSAPMELVRYVSNKTFHPMRLDFGTWNLASKRDASYQPDMQRELWAQGWTDRQMDAARLALESRLDIKDTLLAYHRKELTVAQASARLTELGVATSDLALYFAISRPIPSPSDLVRFALREAWRDDIAQEYGYDQGRPAQFDEWMAKQGYDPIWPKLSWRSHWNVPSAGQGFQMFHRGIIDYDKLSTLLKVNDVAPGWIDPLLGITYNLLTRVDVKRAIRYGKLTPEQVNLEYHKQGYSDRDAEILTDVAVLEAVEEAASLTRSSIEKAYRQGMIERSEAIAQFAPLGVVGEVANFYLDLVDFERDMDLRDRRISNLEKRYKAGSLDEAGARGALDSLGVSPAEIDIRVEEWQIESTSGVKRPTRANLENFVEAGVIDLGQYRAEMRQLNYGDVYIDWYAQGLAYERQIAAEKEAERARTEQERIEKAEVKTAYNEAKARIDVQIAEVNEAIASAQVAMVEAENERDLALSRSISVRESVALQRSYNPAILEADATIDEARVEMADLRSSIALLRERISQIDRSLVENVDVAEQESLRSERLSLQTSIAVLQKQIAEVEAAKSRLQESIARSEDDAEVVAFKREVAGLDVRISDLRVEIATNRERIERIDQALQEVLSAERRATLERERSGLQADIRAIESDIAAIEADIRKVQTEKGDLERELETKLSALPGKSEQISIEQTYAVIIDQLQQNIAEYRSQVASLRLARSRLKVEVG
jgi:predicted  nucleic acid-binding Zn-ribbon protein